MKSYCLTLHDYMFIKVTIQEEKACCVFTIVLRAPNAGLPRPQGPAHRSGD